MKKTRISTWIATVACLALCALIATPPAAADILTVTDREGGRIVRVDTTTNVQTTLLSTGAGTLPDSLLFQGNNIIYDLEASGTIHSFNTITMVDSTIVACCAGGEKDLALDPTGTFVLVSDRGNNRIAKVTPLTAGGTQTTFKSLGVNVQSEGLAYDNTGRLFAVIVNLATGAASIAELNPTTGATINSISLPANFVPDGMSFDIGSGKLWVADNGQVGSVNTGLTTFTAFTAPGLVFDGLVSNGAGFLDIAERTNFHIYQFNIATSTFAQTAGVVLPGLDDIAMPVPGVPEPSYIGLISGGFLALIAIRKYRKSSMVA